MPSTMKNVKITYILYQEVKMEMIMMELSCKVENDICNKRNKHMSWVFRSGKLFPSGELEKIS